MKMKSQLTLAILLATSMFAVGCQQVSSGSQQVASAGSQQTQQTTTDTTGTTTGGTKGTSKPGSCDPKADKNCHSHAAIPGCTDSFMHSHPHKDPKHTHTYGCKGGKGASTGGVKLPPVKAKGVFKGAVKMDDSSRQVMQQYQR